MKCCGTQFFHNKITMGKLQNPKNKNKKIKQNICTRTNLSAFGVPGKDKQVRFFY